MLWSQAVLLINAPPIFPIMWNAIRPILVEVRGERRINRLTYTCNPYA